MMLLDYYIQPAIYVGSDPARVDRIAPLTACFVYIPFANSERLKAPAAILEGIGHDPVDPSLYHLTLLWSESATDEQIEELVAQISKPMQFSVEVTRPEILTGGGKPALVWMINPGPTLIRLQTEIYNAALNIGIPINEYGKPSVFRPHITSAYNLDAIPDNMVQIKPFRLTVDRFTVGRNEYRPLFTIRLPVGISDIPFVERHGDHVGQEGTAGGGSQPGYTHVPGSVEAGGGQSGEDWYQWQDQTIERFPKMMGKKSEEGYSYEPGRWLGLHSEGMGDVFRALALGLDIQRGPDWYYIEEKLTRLEDDLASERDRAILLDDELAPGDDEIRRQILDLWQNAPSGMPGSLTAAKLLNINLLNRDADRIEASIRDIRGLKPQSVQRHLGPGQHPSGSPQEVHAGGGYELGSPQDPNQGRGRWRKYNQPGPTRVWHGTKESLAREIADYGLETGDRWGERPPSVYFTATEEDAIAFAVRHRLEGEASWLLEPGDTFAIVSFDIPDELDPEIVFDEAMRRDYDVDTAYRIERAIPKELLRSVKVYEVTDAPIYDADDNYTAFDAWTSVILEEPLVGRARAPKVGYAVVMIVPEEPEEAVTRTELATLLNGGYILRGVLRKLIGLKDGPFRIKAAPLAQRHYAEIHPGTGTDQSVHAAGGGGKPESDLRQGLKRKETGFGAGTGSGGKRFGKPHYSQVKLDEVADSEDFQELIDTQREWEGTATNVVVGILEDATEAIDPFTDEDLRAQVAEQITAEAIQAQVDSWYDAKAVGREGFPLTPEQMTNMTNAEIHEALVNAASEAAGEVPDWKIDNRVSEMEGLEVGRLKTHDAEGRPYKFRFGREGDEITSVSMTTEWEGGDYRISSFEEHAKKYASYEVSDQTNPNFRAENYEDKDFDSGFVHVNWLAAKRKGGGLGSTMMGQIFTEAAAAGQGVVLEAATGSEGFYEKMGGNYVAYYNMYFWPADQVAALAAEFAEEGSHLIQRAFIQREDLDEVLLYTPEPMMRENDEGDEDDDNEPLSGVFAVSNLDWSKEPRNWHKLFKEDIAAAGFISAEDAAILDARKPFGEREPDEREKMLGIVRTALGNLIERVMSTFRHMGPGPHPSGSPQEVHGNEEAAPEEGGREGSTGFQGMAKMARILKRVLTKKQAIEENPESSAFLQELASQEEEWDEQRGARHILLSFIDDAERWAEGKIQRRDEDEEPEIDWDAVYEEGYDNQLAEEWAEPDVQRVLSDIEDAVGNWFEENGKTWEEVRESLGLSEEELVALGNEEVLEMVYDEAVMEILVDNDYYEEGEFESIADIDHSPTFSGSPIGETRQSLSQSVRELVWDWEMDRARESISQYDIEERYGGELPLVETDFDERYGYGGDDDEEPYESGGDFSPAPGFHYLIGRDDNGEIVSVLSARIVAGGLPSVYDLDRDIDNGYHKNARLTEEEYRDLEDEDFVYLGLLASKRGGVGYGTEMILQGLRIAAENNAGLVGDSTGRAATFYDKLGARWLHPDGAENGGKAIWTPDDVQAAWRWLKRLGLAITPASGPEAEAADEILEIELEESSLLTLRFNLAAFAEDLDLSDEPVALFERRDREQSARQMADRNREWIDMLEMLRVQAEREFFSEKHGKHVGQKGTPEGGSEEGYTHESGSVPGGDGEPEPTREEGTGGGAEPEEEDQEEIEYANFAGNIEQADEWLKEQFGEQASKLKPAELKALAQYKTDLFFGINAYLRGEDLDKRGYGEDAEALEPVIDQIDRVMEGSEITEPITVFRGMDMEDQFSRNFDMLEGEVFQFDGFTSTSVFSGPAERFLEESSTEGETPVMLEIRVPAGSKGIWMDAPSILRATEFLNETEILLDRGLRFRIVSTSGADAGEPWMVVEVVE